MKFGRSSRLTFFIPSLGCGGAELMMLHLARGIAAQGLPLDLVLGQAKGPLVAELPPAVRVIDLGVSRMRYALPGLVRYLRRERPAAILSQIMHANLAVITAKLLADVDTRVVLTEVSTLSASIADRKSYSALPALARWLYPQADQIVAVSEGVARDLERCLRLRPASARVIYNPVVDERMLVRAEERCSHPWLESPQQPVILSVGRLGPEKDHATLLEALAIIRQTRPLRLVIFGEGTERRRLETLRDRLGLTAAVDLPGITANPYSAMRRASLFVLSSRREGLPTVLIEALACGCPVVSTDCPSGPDEILADEQYGLLAPVGNPMALANAMLAALDQPWDREALSARGASFSLDRALPEYLDALGHPVAKELAARAA